MWENTIPSTELPRDFCAGIGPLQLGVVLVSSFFKSHIIHEMTEQKLNRLLFEEYFLSVKPTDKKITK